MDQLKAAFRAARGSILPQPTDEEWQALLEWSRPGSMPPRRAISYAEKCWSRYGVPPRSLTHEKVLRPGGRITSLDLVGHSRVFRREMFHQFDRLAAIIREQHGLLPANHYGHGKPKKRGDTWVGDLWLLSVEFVIAGVLGRTIGDVDRGFELPWETINPDCMATLRIAVRREAGKNDSPPRRRTLEFKIPPAGPTEARVGSGAGDAPGDHIPGRSSGPNGPDDPNDISAKNGTKPIDPQLTRTAVKDMLKALELIDSNWDDYHKHLASAQDELSALRVEVATKSKQLEEYEQQASARLVEMDGLREKLEAQSCQLDQEKKVRKQVQRVCEILLEAMKRRAAENARIKKDLDQVQEAYHKSEAEKARIKQNLDQVLATYRKRDAELASSVATIGRVLRTDGPFPPVSGVRWPSSRRRCDARTFYFFPLKTPLASLSYD